MAVWSSSPRSGAADADQLTGAGGYRPGRVFAGRPARDDSCQSYGLGTTAKSPIIDIRAQDPGDHAVLAAGVVRTSASFTLTDSDAPVGGNDRQPRLLGTGGADGHLTPVAPRGQSRDRLDLRAEIRFHERVASNASGVPLIANLNVECSPLRRLADCRDEGSLLVDVGLSIRAAAQQAHPHWSDGLEFLLHPGC